MRLVRSGSAPEMTRQQVRMLDGFTNAERDDMLYGYFWAASEVVGPFPPIRSFARFFFRRRKLRVFASNASAAEMSVLTMDPSLTAGDRRVRFRPRPRARSAGRGS